MYSSQGESEQEGVEDCSTLDDDAYNDAVPAEGEPGDEQEGGEGCSTPGNSVTYRNFEQVMSISVGMAFLPLIV